MIIRNSLATHSIKIILQGLKDIVKEISRKYS